MRFLHALPNDVAVCHGRLPSVAGRWLVAPLLIIGPSAVLSTLRGRCSGDDWSALSERPTVKHLVGRLRTRSPFANFTNLFANGHETKRPPRWERPAKCDEGCGCLGMVRSWPGASAAVSSRFVASSRPWPRPTARRVPVRERRLSLPVARPRAGRLHVAGWRCVRLLHAADSRNCRSCLTSICIAFD